MGLVTRQFGPNAKGSKLTTLEMDNNLYYLQSLGVSGLTYSANTLTITNPTGGTKSVVINTGGTFTGGTVSGDTIFNNGLSASTFSATTLFGDGSNLTGIVTENYTSVTYSELFNLFTGSTLNPGSYYLMTDFQTCYDQPNYDNNRNPIFSGNSMTGDTEPILLLATSTTGFSPTVYSTLYPQDKITYDISWNTTEISNTPAKGRITERIDNFNNRTDYDHRTILFKRYVGYSYDESSPLGGLVGISGVTGTTAVLYGDTGTTFNSNFSTGSFVGVRNVGPSIFEIISVESDSLAIISGVTINEVENSPYYNAFSDGVMSYYQPNVRANEVFEYTTFGDALSINNYVGNYSNLYIEVELGNFLLANNVFISGSFRNNTIGNGSFNNTFNDDCDNNQIGDSFYNNSTNDDFDGNIIGENFNNNYITANFNNNRIGSDFNYNFLIGNSFYRNNIGNNFERNTWTNGDFQNNEIGNQFAQNEIYNDFYNNDIGNGYNNNTSYSNYYRNLIGNGYNGNTVYSQFYENIIGQVFGNNTIGISTNIGGFDFIGNNIGHDFLTNQIRYNFESNIILNYFYNNSLFSVFRKNSILNGFEGNTIGASNNLGLTFENNHIMNEFKGNNIQGDFWSNQIKNNFKANQTFAEFGYNNIGYGFFVNDMSGQTVHNSIGDFFQFNNCYGSFANNSIGTNFYSNEVLDGFGFGGGQYRGNVIGNNFYDNNIGEYFYDNTIPDNFYNNSIGNYFQWNVINTNIDNTDFTINYGNITGFSYIATGTTASDNLYTGLGVSTNGFGVDATFDVEVSSGSVIGVSGNTEGRLYEVNDILRILGTQIGGVHNVIVSYSNNGIGKNGVDGSYPSLPVTGGSGINADFDVNVTSGLVDAVNIYNVGTGYEVGDNLTILGSQFGGTDGIDDITITVDSIYTEDIVITVTNVSPNPSVYESYTCNIFKNSALSNRLSFYDSSDVLNIKNINE